jgi:hypothetical protein
MNTVERESEEIENVLRAFRQNLREAAERPDEFWMKQRGGIMARLQHSVPVSRWRPAWLWAPAAITIALCFYFFMRRSEAPMPDIAAGYDQKLLIEVEQALRRESPWALIPAALITEEIERGASSPPEKIE